MEKPFLLSRPIPAAIFIVLAVVLDQVLKYLVEVRLPFQQMVPVIPHLALYRTWTRGWLSPSCQA
jgi:signal peptidase II